MPYQSRIKSLEESYRLVEIQINNMQQSGNTNIDKLKSLFDARNKYLGELKILRREQYEASQAINYDDDR